MIGSIIIMNIFFLDKWVVKDFFRKLNFYYSVLLGKMLLFVNDVFINRKFFVYMFEVV